MSDKQNETKTPRFKKTNRKVLVLGAVITMAIAGVFGAQAFAGSKAYAHMKVYTSDHGGWFNKGRHHGHRGYGHRGRFANMSDTEITARIERMVKHVAIEIDATQEQQKKILTLVTAVAKDLIPMRGQMRTTRQEIQNLLLQDTIDRAALEKLRANRLAQADTISKNLTTAVAEIAEVLSVKQRKLLNERIKHFQSKRKRWHRG